MVGHVREAEYAYDPVLSNGFYDRQLLDPVLEHHAACLQQRCLGGNRDKGAGHDLAHGYALWVSAACHHPREDVPLRDYALDAFLALDYEAAYAEAGHHPRGVLDGLRGVYGHHVAGHDVMNG